MSITKDVYQEISAMYPPASVNSSRSIVRGWVDSFTARPSGQRRDEIERDTGLLADFDDGDWGMERESREQ